MAWSRLLGRGKQTQDKPGRGQWEVRDASGHGEVVDARSEDGKAGQENRGG